MRKEFLELLKLGRMPNESIDDDESVDSTIALYDSVLENITLPISYEEGEILISLFPDNAFYDLQWTLLKLVESLIKSVDNKKYRTLIISAQVKNGEIAWPLALTIGWKNKAIYQINFLQRSIKNCRFLLEITFTKSIP